MRLVFVSVQVRRHGARHYRRQDSGRRVLAQWGAGDRIARACHRLQLQPHISSEPKGRQEESAKGNVQFPPLFSSLSDPTGMLSSFPSYPSMLSSLFHSLILGIYIKTREMNIQQI